MDNRPAGSTPDQGLEDPKVVERLWAMSTAIRLVCRGAERVSSRVKPRDRCPEHTRRNPLFEGPEIPAHGVELPHGVWWKLLVDADEPAHLGGVLTPSWPGDRDVEHA